MERRPELTIIAGPNGAGKSRLCPHPSAILVCLHTPQMPIVVTPAEMVEILKDKGLDL